MTEHDATLSLSDTACCQPIESAPPVTRSGPRRRSSRFDSPYQASLYYAAADLMTIARSAPPEKQESIRAIVRLIRALADS